MDRRAYHQEKKSVGPPHQPLSSINDMGRSGTQIVYYGNRKRLLQAEGRHKENSVKGHRKLQQGSWDPHQEESSLWTPGLRKHLLKQYKDPLSLLVETEDRRKRKSSTFFFCEHRNYKYFRRDFYTWTIFKVSQTEGEKENLNREIFFLAIRRERKEEKSSTVNLELTIRKMDQPGKALRMKNEFSSTTTASKGSYVYWKAPEWSRQWRSL